MKKHTKLATNQNGLVSIMVVMVVMGILVLVSTSFALLMRREQRQVTDRQLSTQAFYAAESGIHDAAAKLSTITGDVTDCNNTPGKSTGTNVINASDHVEYTCVLVDKSPDSVKADPVTTDNSKVIRLESQATGPNIDRIDISWQDASEGGVGTDFATNNSHYLPQSGVAGTFTGANGTGILRATLMPVRNPGAITRGDLINDARTYFLYPKGSGSVNTTGSVAWNANPDTNNGSFVDGQCNTGHTNRTLYSNHCNASITGLSTASPFTPHTRVMYLRLTAIYRPVSVTIKIYTPGGNATDVQNSQAVIDSTGKAQDVLRRVQVRVPLKGDYSFPEAAITSMDTICKRASFPGGSVAPIIDLPGAATNSADWTKIDYDRDVDGTVCDPTAP